jgi:hypothetical protein
MTVEGTGTQSTALGSNCQKSFQEKPPTLPATEREEQSSGVVPLQESKVEVVGHPSLSTGHESSNGHGTAQDSPSGMAEPVHDITDPLHCPPSGGYATITQGSDYVGVSEAVGL